LIPTFEKKIQNKSMDIRILIDKSTLNLISKSNEKFQKDLIPIEFFKKVAQLKATKLHNEELDFSLLVTDKGALIFLNKDGEIDYNQCLLDEADSFIEWTTDLFEYYWNKGNIWE
jgi:predicted transcriptional regulator